MSEAAATNGAAAPQPISPVVGARGQHKLSAESFLQEFEGLAAEQDTASEPEAPRARPKPRMERPDKARAEREAAEREAAEQETASDDELPEATDIIADAEAETPAEDVDAEAADEALLPKGKGSRENPLTLKDLPKDKYLEVKIDGKKVVVDLAEAVEGSFMRPEYFHRMVNAVKGDLATARQIAQRAVKAQETTLQDFDAWIRNPELVLGTMIEAHEDVLEQVAIAFAKIRKAEQANPELRLRRMRARDERQIAKRRQELDQREQAERATRENTAKISQLQASWKPGLEAGIRAAGFPAWTPELQEEVGIRLERIRRKNGSITAADWEAAVPAAAKAIGAEPAKAAPRRPAPAPAATPAAPRQAARQAPNGGASVDNRSHSQKMRDPAFFWR